MSKCPQQALMLLSSSLPPQFLLPAWNTPQLLRQLQNYAYKHDRASFSTWEEEREKARRAYMLTQHLRDEFRNEMEIEPRVRFLKSRQTKPREANPERRAANPSSNQTANQLIRYRKTGEPGIWSDAGSGEVPIQRTNRSSMFWSGFKEQKVSTQDDNHTIKWQPTRQSDVERLSEDGRHTHTTDMYESGTARKSDSARVENRKSDSNWESLEAREALALEPGEETVISNDLGPVVREVPASPLIRQTKSKLRKELKSAERYKEMKSEEKMTTFQSSESKGEPSLFEELFPEERQKEVEEKRKAREKDKAKEGWFPISDTSTKSTGIPSFDGVQRLPARLTRPPTQSLRKWSNQTLQGSHEILIISCASKNLEESDFLRINPKGSHIEGWASGMMKVIPGRNPQTLAPNGSYILVFPSSYHAEAYKDSLQNAHRAAQIHTPRSITSPLPTPISKDPALSADMHKIYTLFSPSQKHLSVQKPFLPLRENVRKIVDAGGYPAILQASETPTGQKAGLVLLSIIPAVEGLRSLQGIKGFLERDGRARNLAWRLSGNKENVIMKVESPDPGDKNKWIVSFRDGNEARRFVRVWHRRKWLGFQKMGVRKWEGLDGGEERPRSGEGLVDVVEEEPIVNAELLW